MAGLAIGCGGSDDDNNSGGGPNVNGTFSAPVDFGNKQTGSLSITVAGSSITGTLVSNPPPPTTTATASLDFFIPAGSYDLEGTFTPPRSFSVTGTAPSPGGSFTVTGLLPTETELGSYKLTMNGQITEGVIPLVETPKPVITMTPDVVRLAPGGFASMDVDVVNPPAGTLRYRWFIAAPAAVIEDDSTDQSGQDIETQSRIVRIQTGAADSGKLTLYCHVYTQNAQNQRTFVGETKASIELDDIRAIPVSWVHESATTTGGDVIEAYFWEFSTQGGAKDYVVTVMNSLGTPVQKYRIFQSDIDATEVTTIPYLTGDDPAPPQVPNVHDELSGVVRHQFIRRGNTIRMLIVLGNGFDPEHYRTTTPTSAIVEF
jgi:hypothetical protein